MKKLATTLLTALALLACFAPEAKAQDGFVRLGAVHSVDPNKNWEIGGALFRWGMRSGYHAWNVSNITTLFLEPSGNYAGWQTGYYYTCGVDYDGNLNPFAIGIYYRWGKYVVTCHLWRKDNGNWVTLTSRNYKYRYEM